MKKDVHFFFFLLSFLFSFQCPGINLRPAPGQKSKKKFISFQQQQKICLNIFADRSRRVIELSFLKKHFPFYLSSKKKKKNLKFLTLLNGSLQTLYDCNVGNSVFEPDRNDRWMSDIWCVCFYFVEHDAMTTLLCLHKNRIRFSVRLFAHFLFTGFHVLDVIDCPVWC